MASKLRTCFVCWNLSGFNCVNLSNGNGRIVRVSFPASCKMRHRTTLSSLQHKRQQIKPSTEVGLRQNKDEEEDSEVSSNNDDSVDNTNETKDSVDNTNETEEPLVININGAELAKQLSGKQREDLLGMIRNAEKNILLLNQARVRALEDLEKILAEKDALQGEINALEARLAETDARIKAAAQEKIRVELLEQQLEKLRNELAEKGGTEARYEELRDLQNGDLRDANPLSNKGIIHSLTEELNSLRTENASMKNDLESFKTHISVVKNDDERLVALEKERSSLESALKDLESKLCSQEDVSKLSILTVECKDLSGKVENLQSLLDKATKQADQAVIVLQQNQDLRRKVDELETSLEEANIHKLSSDQLQKYSELMKQKINVLEERLQKSDEELNSYIQLYQKSVKEFQDTLDTLKEQSKRKALEEPVEDMPWEFWSQLLLLIDGWGIEKKISVDDASLLREKVWRRDRRISETYMAYKKQSEPEAISAFLGLLSSETSQGLHVIHIAAEMAPVAKVGGLGDVVSGLGKALQKKGHLVEIVLPKYDCMEYDRVCNLRAPLYWEIFVHKGLNSARICFTCHNFEYQGTAAASELDSCGLVSQNLNKSDKMQDNSARDRVNSVKGGIVFSNIVTTVSPTYAQEVRTAEGGHGLHSTLSSHSRKFVGILNGIDTDAWNPATDAFLPVQYNATDLQGKVENKQALRRKLGLSSADIRRPLVACITRLVPQKGVHLIRHAIYLTFELGGQFVLLGSSPVPHIQKEFEGIANHFQNHDHVRLILKYDESLSHAIYAASDMFIIPSIFEPCGLTQMISMRYGAIPIVRKTGGLNDSVFDVDDDTIPSQFRNGFTFVNPDEQGLNGALVRALNLFKNNPERWKQLVQKDMNIDFSWETSSAEYEDLYLKSVARAKAAKRA
ncbi:probable starch synthase 4, chloroplastic/amyloplastic isoform X3 [Vigna radiata var. radiata]|uniref:Starch synthase, chloroplastic/amyloplastic n=1 Tax=Vigna radiata var. radiata TaxID=3916 RepID=A0A3Q0ERZ2_VIGRR|nr:probable starch synthase 4, chloroplastic/amyloplastic isoform X3 [Vigna radiata var. radiata]